jgi:hypothetical protein
MANGRFDRITNPDGTGSCPVALEDNAVLLSGYCSDLGYICDGMLFAQSGTGMFQALYDRTLNDFTVETFPIGTPIYVYKGTEELNDQDVNSLKAYVSYYDVPLSTNGVTIDSDFVQNFDNYGGVWLQVYLDPTRTRWRPVGIVGSKGLVNKNLYIYLGGYTGDVGGQTQVEADHFMLEVENKLYYFDNGEMTEYELWEMNNQIGWLEALFATI